MKADHLRASIGGASGCVAGRLGREAIERMSLAELEALLSTDSHYNATATRNYGERDPLEDVQATLFGCRCRGSTELLYAQPSAEQVASGEWARLPLREDGKAYFVRCTACGRVGPPSMRGWRAAVDWNFMNVKAWKRPMAQFPFFNLASVPEDSHEARLESIKWDLMLRRAQAKKRREDGQEVGGRYLARIEAYLGWANTALKIVKSQRCDVAKPS